MLHDYFRRTGFRSQLTVIVTSAILALALFSSLINSWESSRRMRAYLIEHRIEIHCSILRALRHAVLDAYAPRRVGVPC